MTIQEQIECNCGAVEHCPYLYDLLTKAKVEVQSQKDGYSQAVQEIGQKQERIRTLEAALRELADDFATRAGRMKATAPEASNQMEWCARQVRALSPQEPTGRTTKLYLDGEDTGVRIPAEPTTPAQEPCAECGGNRRVCKHCRNPASAHVGDPADEEDAPCVGVGQTQYVPTPCPSCTGGD